MRDKVNGADNQQERLRAKRGESSETIRQTPFVERKIVKAYLLGAMHDGTIRRSDYRFRIAQKGTEWLEVIQMLVANTGYKSWIYREGRTRQVYVLESVAPIFRELLIPFKLESIEEKKTYIRGFFDAEGGIPQQITSKRYIQLVQKNRLKIFSIKKMLESLRITTGKIHNPSQRVDPNYWRIFVSRDSIPDFVRIIGSWHPRKKAIFQEWMKIESMPYSDIGRNMNKASLGEPGDGSPPF